MQTLTFRVIKDGLGKFSDEVSIGINHESLSNEHVVTGFETYTVRSIGKNRNAIVLNAGKNRNGFYDIPSHILKLILDDLELFQFNSLTSDLKSAISSFGNILGRSKVATDILFSKEEVPLSVVPSLLGCLPVFKTRFRVLVPSSNGMREVHIFLNPNIHYPRSSRNNQVQVVEHPYHLKAFRLNPHLFIYKLLEDFGNCFINITKVSSPGLTFDFLRSFKKKSKSTLRFYQQTLEGLETKGIAKEKEKSLLRELKVSSGVLEVFSHQISEFLGLKNSLNQKQADLESLLKLFQEENKDEHFIYNLGQNLCGKAVGNYIGATPSWGHAFSQVLEFISSVKDLAKWENISLPTNKAIVGELEPIQSIRNPSFLEDSNLILKIPLYNYEAPLKRAGIWISDLLLTQKNSGTEYDYFTENGKALQIVDSNTKPKGIELVAFENRVVDLICSPLLMAEREISIALCRINYHYSFERNSNRIHLKTDDMKGVLSYAQNPQKMLDRINSFLKKWCLNTFEDSELNELIAKPSQRKYLPQMYHMVKHLNPSLTRKEIHQILSKVFSRNNWLRIEL